MEQQDLFEYDKRIRPSYIWRRNFFEPLLSTKVFSLNIIFLLFNMHDLSKNRFVLFVVHVKNEILAFIYAMCKVHLANSLGKIKLDFKFTSIKWCWIYQKFKLTDLFSLLYHPWYITTRKLLNNNNFSDKKQLVDIMWPI